MRQIIVPHNAITASVYSRLFKQIGLLQKLIPRVSMTKPQITPQI